MRNRYGVMSRQVPQQMTFDPTAHPLTKETRVNIALVIDETVLLKGQKTTTSVSVSVSGSVPAPRFNKYEENEQFACRIETIERHLAQNQRRSRKQKQKRERSQEQVHVQKRTRRLNPATTRCPYCKRGTLDCHHDEIVYDHSPALFSNCGRYYDTCDECDNWDDDYRRWPFDEWDDW